MGAAGSTGTVGAGAGEGEGVGGGAGEAEGVGGGEVEMKMAMVSDACREIVAGGMKPLVFGGDHSLTVCVDVCSADNVS